MTIYTFNPGINTNFSSQLNNNFNEVRGFIGEIRSHCLSIAGATALTTLQSYGWAVANGTDSTSQGITSPIIPITPNLTSRFLYGHATVSGGTKTEDFLPSHTHDIANKRYLGGNSSDATYGGVLSHSDGAVAKTAGTAMIGYEVVFIIRVK
jgi:hypothetical protein